jgi:hypothetical protein
MSGMSWTVHGVFCRDVGLLLTGLPLCLATRAANIFPLSRVANLHRKLPLPLNLQVWALLFHLLSPAAHSCRQPCMQTLPGVVCCADPSLSKPLILQGHVCQMPQPASKAWAVLNPTNLYE